MIGKSATMRIAGETGKRLSKRFNFTVKSVEDAKCPAGADRAWIYDNRQAGLAIMVTAAGAKSFYLYRKVNGRPQRIRLGAFPDISIEQARTLAQSHIGDIAKGIDPMAAKRHARIRGMTLGELFGWFLANYAKPRKRSWRDDENRFKNHLKAWEKRQLTDIVLSDVSALHGRIAEKTSKPTANRVLALLSTLFNKARQIGYTGANPCKGVEKFREESRERYLLPDELSRVMAALDAKETDQDWRDFFKLALFTGARRGNNLAMRWEEIELDAARWTIPAEKFKNGKAMTVALAPQAVDILRARKEAGAAGENAAGAEWVFPSASGAGHLVSPDSAWTEICKRAGVSGVRIHDLRRTFGSWMAGAGVSPTIIGKALGHRSVQATAVYSRLSLDPVRETVNAVAAAMAKPNPPKTDARTAKASK